MTITPEIRSLIDTGPLAHVITLNTDGSPQVSVVWVGIDGNEFVTAHMGEWQKVKNIRRDPRVALSLLGRGQNSMGLQEYLVVYGKARITEGGAAALLQRLARIYLGPHVEFPPEPFRSRPGYIAHISPERFAGLARGILRNIEAEMNQRPNTYQAPFCQGTDLSEGTSVCG